MAVLLNDRNELLYNAASRVTGATTTISAGTVNSLIVPKNSTVPFPGILTLTATIYGYTLPTYAWSYRFGDTGDFIALNSTEATQVVTLDAAWLTAAGTSSIVQYKVTVSEVPNQETGSIGVNQTQGILSIPILREGVDGVDAINNVQVTLYKRTTTNVAPTVDTTGNSTYTFTSSQVIGQPTGWSQTIPDASGGGYLWVIQVYAVSITSSYQFANNLWSAPVLFTQDGASGKNTALVYAYQRSATELTSNPGAVTYSFVTNSISTATLANGWSKTIPSGTSPLYATLATASSITGTDDIAATEWSEPVILARDGADGINTATVYLYARNNNSFTAPTLSTTGSARYNFTTGLLSGTAPYVIPAGWSQVLPPESSGSIIWVTQATAVSAATADNIANTQWSTPQVLAKQGDPGTSPLIYDIVTSSPVITKEAPDAVTSGTHSSITIQGKKYDGSTTTNYGWVTITPNGGTEATTATDTASTPVTLAPGNTEGKLSYTIKLYSQASIAGLIPLDTQVIYVVFKGVPGIDAVSCILSNESHVFPASTTGTVSSYANSGTEIRVYQGAIELTYDGTGTSNGTWKVDTADTNITPGTITDSGAYVTFGNHTGVASGTDTASIVYTITGNNSIGQPFTLVKTQTFSKSKTGSTGTTGVRGTRQLYSADSAYTATWKYGTNANGAASYAVKATELVAAAATASSAIPTTPIQGDTVTFSNSVTKTFNGTISGFVLTAAAGTVAGSVIIGQTLSGGTIAPGTVVTSFISGTGGAGTYGVSISQTVSTSTSITAVTGNFVYTITYTGSAWATPGTVIDGSLLVTGSVTASRINSNSLSIKDPSGNTILDAGNSAITGTLSISPVTGAGFRVGDLTWNASGVRTGGTGLAMTPTGLLAYNGTKTTFSVNAATGDATFAGSLSGADITGATGTFSGALAAGSVTTASLNNVAIGQIIAGSFNLTAFLTPGTYAWVVPAYVYKVKWTVVGGGGGGGDNEYYGSWGGGGGGMCINVFSVTPGASYTVIVGAGGAAGVNGGASSVTGAGIAMVANGGQHGNNSFRTGGGNASGGGINITGGVGYPPISINYVNLGGGGGPAGFIGVNTRYAVSGSPNSGSGGGGKLTSSAAGSGGSGLVFVEF